MQARIIDHKHIQWQSFCNLWCTTESEHMKGQCFCNLWCTTESECVFREQSPCHCAASVQKQPTHHSPSHRQSACVHVCMSACAHVCRSNLPITAHHTGKVHVCMCAEATYPLQPSHKAKCMCACVHECMYACVQKQPTHHGPSHRQSARTHEGRVQKHTRQSARTHEGRVQEHMEAECKNTWRQSAKTHKGNQEDSARVRGVVFAASTVLISIVVTQPCSKNRSPHN